MPFEGPGPEGCNGSAQRAPLPRLRCSTPHILRTGLIDIVGKLRLSSRELARNKLIEVGTWFFRLSEGSLP